MPAVMEDPSGPTIYRVSGQAPFPDPNDPGLPPDIVPRQVTLRDRQTVATIVPFASRHRVPPSLLAYLSDQLNREIDSGDTYPMTEPFTADAFADYWFQTFGAVMLLGSIDSADDVVEGRDWARECLGSFFIKPNYPGRSSHVCNGSFIVTDGSRNRGVGRLMGEAYIDWAPRLGYTYSVFNLVYETNVASCRIWDALGFKRIGRVKACGNLRSHPDRLIDAIIYGRDLPQGGISNGNGNGDELISEERFDKIRYYLKTGKYPNGADRAEKSRLRSAATHYKLLAGDKLMLKDKEVISDPARQYEIARGVHALHHGGINKTTATIAERYHWSRIKETVSDVIRACSECKELGKSVPGSNGANGGGLSASTSRRAGSSSAATTPVATTTTSTTTATTPSLVDGAAGAGALTDAHHHHHHQNEPLDAAERVLALQQNHHGLMSAFSQPSPTTSPGSAYANPSDISVLPSHTSSDQTLHHAHHGHAPHHHHHHHHHNPMLQDQPTGHHHASPDVYQPIDPQIINHHQVHHHHHHNHLHHGGGSHTDDGSNAHTHADAHSAPEDSSPFDHYHQHADFQALLNATEDDDVGVGVDVDVDVSGVVPGHQTDADADPSAVDRDLDMLIEQDDVDVGVGVGVGVDDADVVTGGAPPGGASSAPPGSGGNGDTDMGDSLDDVVGDAADDDDDHGLHGGGRRAGEAADRGLYDVNFDGSE
ncbi:hypothetical protein PLIIFM63780_006140 [Purpureocillium lilacinum]|uniref:uncharacterized protein n=1 Tax=Purpureocillium lilacinum TaxID=33203 RepID=UPI0020840D99|nr:hypothetical protein PLICBS_005591 [Purpureocillium lilacinum]GJN82598.1 hypothetical protein PLIIFM63780_006140 [Purpureocillium lilacinum]